MEIYLIRHTTPQIEKGVCYGQTDLDVTDTFYKEATAIKEHLPKNLALVYSSPLQRCNRLAAELFPQHEVTHHNHLKEIDCGIWEMQHWDAISKEELDPFLSDFVNIAMPQGESYNDLYNRVVDYFTTIAQKPLPAAIVTHGGVIRSILSHITNTPLIEAFNSFKLYYGCVVKLCLHGNNFTYEVLHNIEPTVKEQHRPTAKQ